MKYGSYVRVIFYKKSDIDEHYFRLFSKVIGRLGKRISAFSNIYEVHIKPTEEQKYFLQTELERSGNYIRININNLQPIGLFQIVNKKEKRKRGRPPKEVL